MQRNGCAICIELPDGSFHLETGFDHHLLQKDQDCICDALDGDDLDGDINVVGCRNLTTNDLNLAKHQRRVVKAAIDLLPEKGSLRENFHWQRRLQEELVGVGQANLTFDQFGIPSFL
jgi:hypothetical protein